MSTTLHKPTEGMTQATAVLAAHPGIDLAYVYGSVAHGTARFDSDIDVAVQGSGGAFDSKARKQLIEDIAAATGRSVDRVDLRRVGKPLPGQILKHGRRITGSDAKHAAMMSRHVFDMAGFVPYVERMLKERKQTRTL